MAVLIMVFAVVVIVSIQNEDSSAADANPTDLASFKTAIAAGAATQEPYSIQIAGNITVNESLTITSNVTVIVPSTYTLTIGYAIGDGNIRTPEVIVQNEGTIQITETGKLKIHEGTLTKGETIGTVETSSTVQESINVHSGTLSELNIVIKAACGNGINPIHVMGNSVTYDASFVNNNITQETQRGVWVQLNQGAQEHTTTITGNTFTSEAGLQVKYCIMLGGSTSETLGSANHIIDLTENEFNIAEYYTSADNAAIKFSGKGYTIVGSDVEINSGVIIDDIGVMAGFSGDSITIADDISFTSIGIEDDCSKSVIIEGGKTVITAKLVNKGGIETQQNATLVINGTTTNNGIITNSGTIIIKSDNGFIHNTATYTETTGAYVGLNGNIVLDAAGKDIALKNPTANLNITGSAGSLFVAANNNDVSVSNVTLNSGSLLVVVAKDVTITDVTIGSENQRIEGANRYFSAICNQIGPNGSQGIMYDPGNAVMMLGQCTGDIVIGSNGHGNSVYPEEANSSQGIGISSWSNGYFATSISVEYNYIDGPNHNAIQINFAVGDYGASVTKTTSVDVNNNTIVNWTKSAIRFSWIENFEDGTSASELMPFGGTVNLNNNTFVKAYSENAPLKNGSILNCGNEDGTQEAVTSGIVFNGNKVGADLQHLVTIPDTTFVVEENVTTTFDYGTFVNGLKDPVSYNVYGDLSVPNEQNLVATASKVMTVRGILTVKGTLTCTGDVVNEGTIVVNGGTITNRENCTNNGFIIENGVIHVSTLDALLAALAKGDEVAIDNAINANKHINVIGKLDLNGQKITMMSATMTVASTGKVIGPGTIAFAASDSPTTTLSVAAGGVLGYEDANGKINDYSGKVDIYSEHSIITTQDITGAFTIAPNADGALTISGDVNAYSETDFKSVPRLGVYGPLSGEYGITLDVQASDLTVASGVCVFARGLDVVGDVTINGIIFNELAGTYAGGIIVKNGGSLTIGNEGALRGAVNKIDNTEANVVIKTVGAPNVEGGSDCAKTYAETIVKAGFGGFTISVLGTTAYIDGSLIAPQGVDDKTVTLKGLTVAADDSLIVPAGVELTVAAKDDLKAVGPVTIGDYFKVGTETLIGTTLEAVDDSAFFVLKSASNGNFDITLEGSVSAANGFEIATGDALLNYVLVNGTLTIGDGKTITAKGPIDVGKKGEIVGGTIDFGDAANGLKVMKVAEGGMLTVVLKGDKEGDAKKSSITLTNIAAGAGGITVTKGSVFIDGVLATPDPVTGKITVDEGVTVYVSGTVDEGVTLEIPATSIVVIPASATLEVASGAKVTNNGTIDVQAAGSEVIYEKGSVVNGVVIEVTTKEDKSGVHTVIIIWLVSQDSNKLAIGAAYVEAFSGAKYSEILSLVPVTPLKKSVEFTGWYNTAMNQKISLSDTILPYEHSITACFDVDPRVPVQKEDTPSETIIIDGTTDSQSFAGSDFALPVAIICLIVAILALGFVVLKKR